MRSKYGERWRREKSSVLNDKTRVDAEKYTTILSKASASDQQVVQRFGDIRDGVALLCKPPRELLAALPSQRPSTSSGKCCVWCILLPAWLPAHGVASPGTDAANPAVKELKAVLMQLDQLRAERDSMETEFGQQQVCVAREA
jgi:hypothetical protein